MTGENIVVAKRPNHVDDLVGWTLVEYDNTIADRVRELVNDCT
jgi:hypothetical protein